MAPVYPRVCRALLLPMVLLVVLLTVSRGRRVVLRGWRYLLVLMLRAGWGAQSNLRRRSLLMMLWLMLRLGWDGQRSGRRCAGRLG